ncbi:MAG TPA: hypothetical protein VK507_00410, partial [Iamia sp.]|nr:hypothetical protein [Iamia sp.]
ATELDCTVVDDTHPELGLRQGAGAVVRLQAAEDAGDRDRWVTATLDELPGCRVALDRSADGLRLAVRASTGTVLPTLTTGGQWSDAAVVRLAAAAYGVVVTSPPDEQRALRLIVAGDGEPLEATFTKLPAS